MTRCNETMCSGCSHMKVCSFKEQYLKVVNTLNELTVSLDREDDGKVRFAQLRNIGWIKPIVPECIHFEVAMPTIRNGTLTNPLTSTVSLYSTTEDLSNV